ncbi:MAG: transcription antitermination protein NusB, partial [Chloroflexi bacterium]|nr:transcription antitermination protein NusB [Chloroflexota bacterium]MCI0838856.1 transcription antitermination protein NusB [Chloroflexota bacterium]
AATDRNILRLAIYEIVIDNKVPMRAAINEAVELAKEYGGDNSPRFVNGVLGSVSALVTADRG